MYDHVMYHFFGIIGTFFFGGGIIGTSVIVFSAEDVSASGRSNLKRTVTQMTLNFICRPVRIAGGRKNLAVAHLDKVQKLFQAETT
jgi:hypothetical protein